MYQLHLYCYYIQDGEYKNDGSRRSFSTSHTGHHHIFDYRISANIFCRVVRRSFDLPC